MFVAHDQPLPCSSHGSREPIDVFFWSSHPTAAPRISPAFADILVQQRTADRRCLAADFVALLHTRWVVVGILIVARAPLTAVPTRNPRLLVISEGFLIALKLQKACTFLHVLMRLFIEIACFYKKPNQGKIRGCFAVSKFI